ncbi:MAG: hypothetical protein R3B55_02500 [Candidatus Paceibacterota bacterium]
MENQSTLVLLGIDTQIEVSDSCEKMVVEYITRIIPVIERSIRERSGDNFIIIDDSIPNDFSDVLTFVSIPTKKRYEFIQPEKPGQAILKKIREHFTKFPGSTLIILADKNIAEKVGFKVNIQEAANPKMLLNVITLP